MTNAILSVTREPPFKYAHVRRRKFPYENWNMDTMHTSVQCHHNTHTLPHKLISKFTFTCMQMQRNEWKKKKNCIYNLILSFLHSLRAEIFFATFYNETDFSCVCVHGVSMAFGSASIKIANVPWKCSITLCAKEHQMVLWCAFFSS